MPSFLNELISGPNLPTTIPTTSKKKDSWNSTLLNSNTITTEDSLHRDDDVIAAAKRFARDRNGIDDELSDKEAIKNFISHFRSFNVNELTAGGDWNYISGVSADAEKENILSSKDVNLPKIAQQKFDDYSLLYKKFKSLPSFYEEGGAEGAFGDYFWGLASAPSTLVGLIPMFGQVAKGGTLAATTALKVAVNKAVTSAAKKSTLSKITPFTSLTTTIGQHPIKASMMLEGAAGGLQDVGRQNVEMEIGVKDEYSLAETGIGIGAGMAAPGFLGVVGTKMAASKAVSQLGQGKQLTGDVIKGIDASMAKKIADANKKANETLKNTGNLSEKIAKALPPLNPEQVAKGTLKGREIMESLQIVPDMLLSIDPSRTKRIFAAVTELINTDKQLAKEFMTSFKTAKGDKKLRPVQAIADILRKEKVGNKIREDFVTDLFEKYSINADDFANMFLSSFSNAGRTLVQAKHWQDLFRSLSDDTYDVLGMDLQMKEMFNKVKNAGTKGDTKELLKVVEGDEGIRPFRFLDDVRLAAMTSQTATTVRNTASGYTRVGADTFVNIVDRSIATAAKAVGGGKGKVGWFDATPNDDVFSLVFGLTNKTETEAIDSLIRLNFHKQAKGLYRELQDIELGLGKNTSKKLTAARAIGKQLNALNTVSDNYFKRIALISSLKKKLNQSYTRTLEEFSEANYTTLFTRAGKLKKISEDTIQKMGIRGDLKKAIEAKKPYEEIKNLIRKEYDIIDMMKTNRFGTYLNGKVGQKVLKDSIQDALYFTYQKTPDLAGARSILNFAHKAPFLTSSLVPFPRFIMNAMRFTYEYSPAYLLSPMNNAFRKSLAKDSENYAEVSKGLVGTAGIWGAMAFRESEWAGENWWEGRLPNGKTFDLRPFFPAAPYLFLGDVINRTMKGEPVFGKSSIKETAQALSGTQFRAGFGLWALDEGIDDIFTSEKGFDKFDASARLVTEYAANLASTYTIPITPVKDIYDTWFASDDARIARDNKSSNMYELFLRKSLSRIPNNYRIEEILAESLGLNPSDAFETPLKGETVRRFQPFARQAFGILQRDKKNFLEKEIVRLKLDKSLINRNSGVPEADNLINNLIGEWTSTYLSPLLETSKEYKDEDNAGKRKFIRLQVDAWKQQLKELVFEMEDKEESYNQFLGVTTHDKYGFNPLKKAKVLKKFKGVDKQYLNDAFDQYHEKYGMPGDELSYDWDIVWLYANAYKDQAEARLSPN